MNIFDIHNEQMTAIQDEWPDSLTFDGQPYPCIVVSLSEKETIAIGESFGVALSLTLQIQISRFATLPDEKSKITYDGKDYGIITTLKATNKAALRLVLGDYYGS